MKIETKHILDGTDLTIEFGPFRLHVKDCDDRTGEMLHRTLTVDVFKDGAPLDAAHFKHVYDQIGEPSDPREVRDGDW